MIRYRNTDNGMTVEVPDWMAARYDRAPNMERIVPEPPPTPPAKPKRKRKASK